jgi:hypothetical protein
MLADQLDYLIGVDSHRDVHAVAIVERRTGVVAFEATVAADVDRYGQALRLAEHALGRRVVPSQSKGRARTRRPVTASDTHRTVPPITLTL